MTTTQNTSTDILVSGFGMTDGLLRANVAELRDGEAGRRPQPAGNSATWIVGHIVYWRQAILELLGEQPTWDQKANAHFDGTNAGEQTSDTTVALSELMAVYEECHERLIAVLGTLDDRQIESRLSKLLIHEAYHVGQVGLSRRLLGKPGAINRG